MNALYDELKLDKPNPVHEQIRKHVRELILSGKLAPNERLPSDQQLAEKWGTHKPTVHLALTPLVREGLLMRVNRVGTFVRQREAKLTCVGIYDTTRGIDVAPFRQSLQAALKKELAQLDIEMDLWIDPRPDEQIGEPWLPLVRAAEHREFQAIIGTIMDLKCARWFSKLPVPSAFYWATGHPHEVNFDYQQFAELGVRALVEQGCRSVGFICPLGPDDEFFGRILDSVSDVGLTMKNEWMRQPPGPSSGGAPAQVRFGREQFLRVWAQPERPDGLIVYPDTAARGVILGLLEKQVRVPEDLKLVLHKNAGVDLLCPPPATFLISDEREMARGLIKQVQKQFRGESCERILVPFQRMAHDGSSQKETNQPTEEGSQS